MKNTFVRLLVVAGALSILVGALTRAEPQDQTATVKAELRSLIAELNAGFAKRDRAALERL